MTERIERIRSLLERDLAPLDLEVLDDSAAHAGHAGAAGGGGHFLVRIVSARFAGLPLRERHRLVQESLAPLFEKDIHALSIEARVP